jgi:C-terminal processing protease CtpA/Prc
MSYTEELRKLPKQHVFAPPGKIGVAIDVLNGQPIVHKVRKGSPLEKMLQPNDIIMAIDDEDMSCMSAADVTSKMVRTMDRVRKITFVRRPMVAEL